MHVFVTNLDTSKDRKKHIEKELNKTGVVFSFVKCIVGADLTEEEIEQKCDKKAIAEHNKTVLWINKGIIGCTMTNQKTYQRMLEENISYALLLEDDTILPDNLVEVLSFVETFIKQGDVILLFSLSHHESRLRKLISYGKFHFYTAVDYMTIVGGSAFIVTKEAAKKMLLANTPIHITPDAWGYYVENGCINRLIIAKPDAVMTSDFRSTMRLGKFKGIVDIIDKYRIFPLYQILRRRRNKLKLKMQNFSILNA